MRAKIPELCTLLLKSAQSSGILTLLRLIPEGVVTNFSPTAKNCRPKWAKNRPFLAVKCLRVDLFGFSQKFCLKAKFLCDDFSCCLAKSLFVILQKSRFLLWKRGDFASKKFCDFATQIFCRASREKCGAKNLSTFLVKIASLLPAREFLPPSRIFSYPHPSPTPFPSPFLLFYIIYKIIKFINFYKFWPIYGLQTPLKGIDELLGPYFTKFLIPPFWNSRGQAFLRHF